MVYFEVINEGKVNQFDSFTEALDEYNSLREEGKYKVNLHRVEKINNDKCIAIWSAKNGCFF